jgi:hypothetical protein
MAEIDARLAETAAWLLRDDVFNRILAEAEGAYMDALMNCPEKDDIGRYRFLEAVKVCRAVKGHLQAMVEGGKLEKKLVENMNKTRKGLF